MVVPNAVHYVYGLKPLGEGEQPDEFPYYAYLAMRSALINLKPEKMFLLVYSPVWNRVILMRWGMIVITSIYQLDRGGI